MYDNKFDISKVIAMLDIMIFCNIAPRSLMDDGKEEKKCKGISKAVVKKTISFNDYRDCLFNKVNQIREMNVIRNHHREMYAETVNKIAPSANDDKRIIRKDGIHTFAYGHYLASSEVCESERESDSDQSVSLKSVSLERLSPSSFLT